LRINILVKGANILRDSNSNSNSSSTKSVVLAGFFVIAAAVIGSLLAHFLTTKSYEDEINRLNNELQTISNEYDSLKDDFLDLQERYELIKIENEKLNELNDNLEQSIPDVISTIINNHNPSDYHSVELSGTVAFECSNNNGSYTIGNGEYEFATSWSANTTTSVRAYSLSSNIEYIALCKDNLDINEKPDISNFDFSSDRRTPSIGDSIIWINNHGHIAVTRIVGAKDDRVDDIDEVLFEYIIFKAE
jgi:outer membrane murein-binding lipoprotein Lpp